MSYLKNSLALLFTVIATFSCPAEVRLPKIFGDNMVLQRDTKIPVWGWATAGEKIILTFNKQTKTIKAGKDGRWMIRLDPEKAGGPFELMVTGKNRLTITNILVGEVWLCSGQSNMEMPIEGWGKINNYEKEIKDASFPEIRHFKVPNLVSSIPEQDIKGGGWKICSPANAGEFSATAYFFARELYRKLHVPIGLVNSSWGGTHVETWTSKAAFERSEEFKSMIGSMPALNLDSLAKQKRMMVQQKIESIQGKKDDPATIAQWKETSYEDNRWPHMKLPGLWEQQGMGLEDLDGEVWFRKEITLSAEDAGKAATLELGKIDDSDDSYVNGEKIGSTLNKYSEERKYTIPAGLLKEGKNTIAVRVEDTGGGGGIYGEEGSMKITIGNKTIPLNGDWKFRIASTMEDRNGIGPNDYPTLLFNAMINPLVPFAIKGAIWYQGEANAGRAYQYRKAFPLMITDWRQHWNEGNFPFYFVQLASFNAGNGDSEHGSTWAELREAQTMTLALPNTGMAVTTDIGNSTDIHPKNKQEVGRRLALIALNNTYSVGTVFSGPVFKSFKTEGNKAVISFSQIGSGLMTNDKYGYLRGFEIAGSDQKFYFARAIVEGENVIVTNEKVSVPVAVRFAWSDDAMEANLFNIEGLPAVPFRTDQWKNITTTSKFSFSR